MVPKFLLLLCVPSFVACCASLMSGCANSVSIPPQDDAQGISDGQPDVQADDEPEGDPQPQPFVTVVTVGMGAVVETVASGTGVREWFAIAEDGWTFNHWELVGSSVGPDGVPEIHEDRGSPSNPFQMSATSNGVLTAVFREDVIELQPPVDPSFDTQRLLDATWQIVAYSSMGGLTASAFAIDEDLFGTNAHVVEGLARIMAAENAVAFVAQHETGHRRNIIQLWVHSLYAAGNIFRSPDVGVVRVNAKIRSWLDLDRAFDNRSLELFDALTLCGFPGDVTDIFDSPLEQSYIPRATCLTGKITALRPFNPADPATSANTFLIQHDIPTTHGTSGSAIVNDAGVIVAINHAGTLDPLSLNRFAIRRDFLDELLGRIRSGVQEPLHIP